MKKYQLSFLLIASLVNFYTSIAQTNSKRIKDIETALPVIDKIFKDYADKNHFPGIIYGLVAEGKLIHTFNTGYTVLKKKSA